MVYSMTLFMLCCLIFGAVQGYVFRLPRLHQTVPFPILRHAWLLQWPMRVRTLRGHKSATNEADTLMSSCMNELG